MLKQSYKIMENQIHVHQTKTSIRNFKCKNPWHVVEIHKLGIESNTLMYNLVYLK